MKIKHYKLNRLPGILMIERCEEGVDDLAGIQVTKEIWILRFKWPWVTHHKLKVNE